MFCFVLYFQKCQTFISQACISIYVLNGLAKGQYVIIYQKVKLNTTSKII